MSRQASMVALSFSGRHTDVISQLLPYRFIISCEHLGNVSNLVHQCIFSIRKENQFGSLINKCLSNHLKRLSLNLEFTWRSDVPNPRLTCQTRFMFKQKQNANRAKIYQHLCTHIACTRSQAHRGFSASFFGSNTQRCLAYSPLCLKKTYTLILALS